MPVWVVSDLPPKISKREPTLNSAWLNYRRRIKLLKNNICRAPDCASVGLISRYTDWSCSQRYVKVVEAEQESKRSRRYCREPKPAGTNREVARGAPEPAPSDLHLQRGNSPCRARFLIHLPGSSVSKTNTLLLLQSYKILILGLFKGVWTGTCDFKRIT